MWVWSRHRDYGLTGLLQCQKLDTKIA